MPARRIRAQVDILRYCKGLKNLRFGSLRVQDMIAEVGTWFRIAIGFWGLEFESYMRIFKGIDLVIQATAKFSSYLH